MLISTITSNIPFIQLSLMHRITEKICKERWQHWCTKISGVKVLPTLLISTITSNMSLMLSGYPASSYSKPQANQVINLVNFLPMCLQKWTTTTYPKTQKSYPNPTLRTRHHVNLPETVPSRRLGTNVVDVVAVQVQLCHRFVHLERLSDGLRLRRPADPGVRQGQVPRRPGPWGVMGCTCSCGWVFRKYVDYR